MVSEYLGRVRSLEELYSLMDRDRLAAARFIESAFHADVEAAITNIVEISSVANARVMADTQVASAKLLIDAEVASARLVAGAEMAIIEFKHLAGDGMTDDTAEHFEAMIQEIGRAHTGNLTESARRSIAAIEEDAAAAIAKLKEIGKAAISDIREFATVTSLKTQVAAAEASERLTTFRQHPHSLEEAIDASKEAQLLVTNAADQASTTLRQTADTALRNVHATTDEACAQITASATLASKRIELSMEKAVVRIHEIQTLSLSELVSHKAKT
jgi:hypothetical protein